ncbi:ABC transporter permease [Endozoicomonas arenosclerae]|uniref:ABC transporter permease n=1 Tax=Endozoicomonas arenosclerae TaxID=1633495 RepID=UPI0007803FFF|nr:ABC transporter permease [Endozoicomonas arenosclerae]
MQARSPLKIQIAVLHALLIRELKTRFGSYRLGMAWAFIEPILQIAVFMGLFYFGGRDSVGGLELPLFLATGIAPFLYFQKVINQCMNAVTANTNLLIYRQVRVFDTFLTRFLLEAITSFIVLAGIITATWWLGYEVNFVNTLIFIYAYILLSILAFGLGLIFGTVNTLFPEIGKFIPTLLRPLMFISCTFFTINDLPSDAQSILLWNPLIHAFEFMRSSFSYDYNTSLLSLEYLEVWALMSLTLGLLVLRANWRRMLTS